MPNKNTSYTTANSINISQDGIYEINYSVSLTSSIASILTFSVRNNSTSIASTTLSKDLSTVLNTTFSGTTIVSLAANAVLDLAISSSVNVSASLNSDVNAILTVKRLN